MAELIGFALIFAGGYALLLYAAPFRRCRWCGGTGRKARGRGRSGVCRRCGGAARVRRFGAATVHRGAVALRERAGRRRG